MRFGIKTLDDASVQGKTVLCRVDINQPVDRVSGTLKSINRIQACVPTIRELSDKGAKVVLLAHQGSDIEYKNYYTTKPHAAVLSRLLEREKKITASLESAVHQKPEELALHRANAQVLQDALCRIRKEG